MTSSHRITPNIRGSFPNRKLGLLLASPAYNQVRASHRSGHPSFAVSRQYRIRSGTILAVGAGARRISRSDRRKGAVEDLRVQRRSSVDVADAAAALLGSAIRNRRFRPACAVLNRHRQRGKTSAPPSRTTRVLCSSAAMEWVLFTLLINRSSRNTEGTLQVFWQSA